MYDDVLLPVALGEVEENPAVDHAIDLARTYGATLHVLSALDPKLFDPMTAETGTVREALEESAETNVERVAGRAEDAGLDVHTVRGDGAPHQVIADYAADEGVDCIVMATHGREGLEHALLGSVTEKVVRVADVPVLTVPLS